MIVLLAHLHDPWAPELAKQVEACSGVPTRVLTPRDLSRPGWAMTVGDGGHTIDQCVISEEQVPGSQVELLVSLIERVSARELVWICETDLNYVADEMTAFLRFWLETLAHRVLVPPGAYSLAGPEIPLGSWAEAAGLRCSAAGPIDWRRGRGASVTDGVVSGGTTPSLARAVTAMAQWAAVPWLRAYFSPDAEELWGVVTLPDLSESTPQASQIITRVVEGRWAR